MPSLQTALPLVAATAAAKAGDFAVRLLKAKAEVAKPRAKAKPLYKPIPTSWTVKQICRHGIPIYVPEAEVCSGVPFPTVTAPHVVPLTSDGNYKIPELNRRCPDCINTGEGASGDRQQAVRATRDYGLSTAFIEEETLLNRRLTLPEVKAMIAYVTHTGASFNLHKSQWNDGSLLYARRPDAAEMHCWEEGAPYPGHLAMVERWNLNQAAARILAENAAIKREYERQVNADRAASQREKAARTKNATSALAAMLATEIGRRDLSLPPPETGGPIVPLVRRTCSCEYLRYEDECRCGAYQHNYDLDQARADGHHRRSSEHGMPFMARKCDRIKRLVGVELEYNEQTDLSPWVNKWRGAIHSDGSCGWEAVTTPIAGGHIEACIKELTRALRRAGTGANESCGIHVHVDCRDVTWPDMARLVRLYAMCEPILYLIAGQNRLNGSYSKPCGPAFLKALNASDPKAAITEAALDSAHNGHNGRHHMRLRPSKKDGGRYKGLNIIPWLAGRRTKAPDCTVEFRIHRNSLDGARIAGWANLCAALVDYACRTTDVQVMSLPKSALRVLCDHVAPELKAWILKRVADWRRATTAERTGSDANGNPLAKRRISTKGGVYSCKPA